MLLLKRRASLLVSKVSGRANSSLPSPLAYALKPKEVVEALDKHIVGQPDAKVSALSVYLCPSVKSCFYICDHKEIHFNIVLYLCRKL